MFMYNYHLIIITIFKIFSRTSLTATKTVITQSKETHRATWTMPELKEKIYINAKYLNT